jgi:hypothetical protein
VKLARIAVPDLVSNSYFPAIAAIELGCFREHGLDAIHELIFPNYRAYEVLRDGAIDFVANSVNRGAAGPQQSLNLAVVLGAVKVWPGIDGSAWQRWRDGQP